MEASSKGILSNITLPKEGFVTKRVQHTLQLKMASPKEEIEPSWMAPAVCYSQATYPPHFGQKLSG